MAGGRGFVHQTRTLIFFSFLHTKRFREGKTPWKIIDPPPPLIAAVDLGLTVDDCERLIDVMLAVSGSVLVLYGFIVFLLSSFFLSFPLRLSSSLPLGWFLAASLVPFLSGFVSFLPFYNR